MSRPSTPAQRQNYHRLLKVVGDPANGLLKKMTKKTSSTEVSFWQMDEVIKELERMKEKKIASGDLPAQAKIIPIERPWHND